MKKNFLKMLSGYQLFRKKYALGDQSIMHSLSHYGQKPEVMIVACSDSRVDPALILQCDPGDLFVVRNVANIIPPYEKDEKHHGTSAALEFGICFLNVKHLILLGHSQCGGIEALLNTDSHTDDFITHWVSLIKTPHVDPNNPACPATRSRDPACPATRSRDPDNYAKCALNQSHQNCLTFPWIHDKVRRQELLIHVWFFDIKMGEIFTYCDDKKTYQPL